MIDENELLRRYAETGDEAAFREVVRRRIGLVYAVALRRTGGNTGAAQDAAQVVFCDLARKAHTVCQRPVLAAWLYRSAQYAAADIVRAERRRHYREQEAASMNLIERDIEPDWERLRPVIDDVLQAMDERDREAVVLRFFDGRTFAEVGAKLRLTENAARMRVERALDRLRAQLQRRGVSSTASALGVVLANQVTATVPTGLAASVAGSALAGGAVAAGIFMGMTTLQMGAMGALALGGVGVIWSQAEANAVLREELVALTGQQPAMAALRTENQRLATLASEVEQLRADDGEFQRLSESVAQAQLQARERAQAAQVRAQQSYRAQREAEIREKDRRAQAEVDRMNQEGNRLVGQFKELREQSKATDLTAEQHVALEAAMKAKLAAIQAKQKEVRDYIAASRKALMAEAAELRGLPGGEDLNLAVGRRLPEAGGAGRLELRPGVDGTAAPGPGVPGRIQASPSP